jgi:hypothetical protein
MPALVGSKLVGRPVVLSVAAAGLTSVAECYVDSERVERDRPNLVEKVVYVGLMELHRG